MIADGDRVYGHRFDGYWRDVGTIQSYHDAHMELLAEPPALNLYDRGWPIHTDRGTPAGPHRIGRARGAVAGLARLPHHGHVERSVLSPACLSRGRLVRDSIVC